MHRNLPEPYSLSDKVGRRIMSNFKRGRVAAFKRCETLVGPNHPAARQMERIYPPSLLRYIYNRHISEIEKKRKRNNIWGFGNFRNFKSLSPLCFNFSFSRIFPIQFRARKFVTGIMGVPETDPLSQLSLPPGFRFYPTDEELLVQYLCRKVAGYQFNLQIIAEIDLYKFDPWVLPSKAIFGEKEWYFFSPRDRKYPNGSRPNRVAGTGYWKATGTDKVITTEGRKVGIKKALVFYVGKAPKGTKTNWIMHEYRLIEPSRKNGSSKLDEWVLCRIYKKSSSSAAAAAAAAQKPVTSVSSKEHSNGSSSSCSSQLDDVLEWLPDIDDRNFTLPRINSLKTLLQQQEDSKINFLNTGSGNFDWATLAGLNSAPELNLNNQTQQGQGQMNFNFNNNGVPPFNPTSLPRGMAAGEFGKTAEEEVQSGLRTQRVDNSNFFQQHSQNVCYPVRPSGFGLWQ